MSTRQIECQSFDRKVVDVADSPIDRIVNKDGSVKHIYRKGGVIVGYTLLAATPRALQTCFIVEDD